MGHSRADSPPIFVLPLGIRLVPTAIRYSWVRIFKYTSALQGVVIVELILATSLLGFGIAFRPSAATVLASLIAMALVVPFIAYVQWPWVRSMSESIVGPVDEQNALIVEELRILREACETGRVEFIPKSQHPWRASKVLVRGSFLLMGIVIFLAFIVRVEVALANSNFLAGMLLFAGLIVGSTAMSLVARRRAERIRGRPLEPRAHPHERHG